METIGPSDARAMKARIQAARRALPSGLRRRRGSLRRCVDRVQVGEQGKRIGIRLSAVSGEDADEGSVLIDVPVRLQRSGVMLRLIVGDRRASPADADPKLIRLLARGVDWLDGLTSGRVDSIASIAQQEECTGSFVTRVLYAACLCPDLIQRIVAGERPPGLDAQRLLTMGALPERWDDQARVFGMGG